MATKGSGCQGAIVREEVTEEMPCGTRRGFAMRGTIGTEELSAHQGGAHDYKTPWVAAPGR